MTQLKALIASGILLPIAGGATMEEYDEAIAGVPEEKQDLRRKLDSLVTNWLIASRSPSFETRQEAVERISEELNRLIAENPNDETSIRVVHRYIVEEYREEAKVGQTSNTDRFVEEGLQREVEKLTREEVHPSVFLNSPESQRSGDWERKVQELHRMQHRRMQPYRRVSRAIPEIPIERVTEPAPRSVEPKQPRPPSMWMRVAVNAVGLLILGGTILGLNHLLGNPIGDAITWLASQLPMFLDSLKTTILAQ